MVLFMTTNFQKWVYKENVRLFTYMVLFCDYKFSKMSIQVNKGCFFLET